MGETLQLNAAEHISRLLLRRIGVWIAFYVVYFFWLQVKRKEFAQELPVIFLTQILKNIQYNEIYEESIHSLAKKSAKTIIDGKF